MSYTYDSTGKVLSMTDPSGTTAYSYDNANRLTKETKTIEGKAFVVSYAYSLSGALTSIAYPNGRVVSYEYDPIGRIVRVMEEKDGKRSEIIKSIAYLPNGAVSSITQGNGIVTTQGYDVNGALSSMNIGNLKKLTYTRDGVGNITAINDLLDASKTKTYHYDVIYRLTQASLGTVPDLPAGAVESGLSPYSIRYEYDPVGNRTKETTSSGTTDYSYGSANKLLSSSGAKAFNFSYDNNGNTVTENTKQYIYNQNQRLIKATENGNTLGEYLYNGNGQRVKKVANNKTTYFIYDQYGNLIEEADEQGQVNSDYIYLGNIPISRIDEWWEGMKLPEAPTGLNLIPGDKQLSVSWNESPAPVDGYKVYWGTESKKYTSSKDVGKTVSYTITGLTNGTMYYVSATAYADLKETYFYHTDHLGTPVLMTDKNKNVVWDGEFLPYGEEYSITGTIINNLRFPGQYLDKETGKYQNWFRDYNPEIGAFPQRDPIGLLGGVNPYVYPRNPVNMTDPLGLFWQYLPRLAPAVQRAFILAQNYWQRFGNFVTGLMQRGCIQRGISVIGPRDTYREFARKIGANFLDVADDAWTWAKNEEFLKGIVQRGDDVIFAGKFDPSKFNPNTPLGREINYLIEHRYQWADDFTKLIKK